MYVRKAMILAAGKGITDSGFWPDQLLNNTERELKTRFIRYNI